ncbi:helix-turn-helix domain-containing protein [Streptomyces sp. NPDC056194]|uniref:helix-turn-helix domain-containing protein n=1 Tax=Streptomyces sp. NPDC056194 TaxID=3345744 RepID=UPI0035D81C78
MGCQVARGTGTFNGPALRAARQEAGLSAERLAKQVGTTKAMVLAYEAGKTIPEAGRAAALADALGVSRAALLPISTVREEPDEDPRQQMQYEVSHNPALRLAERFGTTKEAMEALLSVDGRVVPRMYDRSIRDLRQIAGLSVAEAASRAGISVSTYRAIEKEGRLPSRGNGRFPALLAGALGTPVKQVEDALILNPSLVARHIAVAEVFRRIFSEVEKNPDLSASPTSPEVRDIANILAQPPAILARAVNYQIDDYRRALRRQADAVSRAKYPLVQERRMREGALKSEVFRARRRLRHAPEQAAASTWWSLSQALTVRQWRTFVTIVDIQTGMSNRVSFSGSMIEPEVGSALLCVRFRGHQILEAVSDSSYRSTVYRFTPLSISYYDHERDFYSYLYPRIYSPNVRFTGNRDSFSRIRQASPRHP